MKSYRIWMTTVLLAACGSSEPSSTPSVTDAGVVAPVDAGIAERSAIDAGAPPDEPIACMPGMGTGGCPNGFGCQGTAPMTFQCVACLGPPESIGGACVCPSDCDEGLACTDGICRQTCDQDDACDSTEECVPALLGPGTCQPVDPACAQTGDVDVGQPCGCNADCGQTPGFCLDLSVGGMSAGRVCSVRGCDTGDTNTCASAPGQTATTRCCGQAPLLEPVCLPDPAADLLQQLVTCSP